MKAMPLHSLYFSLMLCGLMSLAVSFEEATPSIGCSEVERDALLAFKAKVRDPSRRLASWSLQIDCCKWIGVVCKTNNASLFGAGQNVVELNLQNPNVGDEHTALRGEMLSPSLLNLTRLERLNLSWNDFEGAQIPQFIGSFLNLKYLELCQSNFSGVIPPQLGNLSSLRHLGLRSLWGVTTRIAHRLDWLSGLPSLRYLDLAFVNLSTISQNWLSEVNIIPSLEELYLHECDLNHIPSSFNSHLNLSSLLILDLGNNDFDSTMPNWLWNLTKLSTLNFYSSSLLGPLSTEIGTLSHDLTELYLGGNNLTGSIPATIANLSSLQSLFLFVCSLNGQIPSEIGNLTSLTLLSLSFNSLSGPIPNEIWKLSNLEDLDLSYNSLVSVVSELQLANLTNLESLELRENSAITISLDYDWVPPFQLQRLDLASCIVGPRFPQWLRSQKSMEELSLSNTSIEDNVPNWLWNISFLSIIDLSRNKLSGTLPSSLESMSRLAFLVLRSNKLEGVVPSWPPDILALDLSFNNFSALPIQLNSSFYAISIWRGSEIILSNNQISGSIPSYFCDLKQLGSLNLSDNQLSGEIPNCWQGASTSLFFVHLGNNKLSGEIPESLGNLIGLQSLHLNNNNLGGHLPLSLQNCSGLVVLDLADNKFSGSIPTWIGQSLQSLTILRLRSNDFSGILPANLGELKDLQIVDLANNNLSGEIPYSFGNFNAITSTIRVMAQRVSTLRGVNDVQFGGYDSVSVVTKGDEYIFSSILYLVKSIDLSNNSLTGEIPTTAGSLAGLQTLNLSRNNLRGNIPYTIGGMISLETLDLSFNNLSGVIPQSLSALLALSHLNLSYNNLSGQIPSGNQLQTLEDVSIYKGNIFLCGNIIHKNCSDYNRNSSTVEEYQNDKSQLLPLYLGGFIGYVTGLWGVFIILLFKKEWRNLYFRMIDKMYDKAYVAIKIRMNRFSTD